MQGNAQIVAFALEMLRFHAAADLGAYGGSNRLRQGRNAPAPILVRRDLSRAGGGDHPQRRPRVRCGL